ncbi:MAG TPA: N-formylglutamate amidohydrolase [Polyangiaceae bacterium]|nr:N-formylglutamate amidohydrolase [Polyangiaceae bacterium]
MTPFRVETPDASETPLVVEVPHAGVHIDGESLAWMCAPARAIGRDADLWVDRLFEDAPRLGATLLVSSWSRYVLDLNRGPDDYDGLAVEGGPESNLPRGLVWRTSTEGDPILARRLTQAELARRKAALYDPYHDTLSRLLDEKRQRFGHAILLCAHSMPSSGRRGHVDVGAGRADVVPGSRGRTSAASSVIDCVERVARGASLTVKHDDPYKGGFATQHYGQPARACHAVQVELARRLYMDEDSLAPLGAAFDRVRAFARALVTALGKVDPAATSP